MKNALIFLLCNLSFILLTAQSPQVVNTVPVNQEITASVSASIEVTFDQPLDLSTVDYGTFKVFGRWSGPMPVAFSFSNNNQTVELIPEQSFSAGEWVTVTLTKSIQASNGESLTTAFTWNFWIATASGELEQTLVKSIEMRLPGEGWIESYGAYAGDLNNDGYSDLTIVNEESDDLRIMLNDGTGDYSAFEVISMGSERPSPNEGADFNSDGEIDLVVTTVLVGEVRVLFGDGEGSFSTVDTYDIGEALRGVVVTDLDGDGNEDIIVTNRDGDNLTFFENDGFGDFAMTELDIDPAGLGENGCAITDANQDGIPDLFVGNFHSEDIALFLGDGDGNFTLSSKQEITGKPWMITVGDLNGDGFADVASANSSGNNMSVLFGDGAGNLSAPDTYTYPNAIFPLAIDLGDLDGDGDLEIVTSNYTSGNFSVYENNGDGVFFQSVVLASPANASCAILHDRDNDGDLDITGTDETDDIVLLFRNGEPSSVVAALPNDFVIQTKPNPFTEGVWLNYTLEDSQKVKIELLDVRGMKLLEVKNETQSAGEQQWFWDAKGIELGIYFLRVRIGDEERSVRVVRK